MEKYHAFGRLYSKIESLGLRAETASFTTHLAQKVVLIDLRVTGFFYLKFSKFSMDL